MFEHLKNMLLLSYHKVIDLRLASELKDKNLSTEVSCWCMYLKYDKNTYFLLLAVSNLCCEFII